MVGFGRSSHCRPATDQPPLVSCPWATRPPPPSADGATGRPLSRPWLSWVRVPPLVKRMPEKRQALPRVGATSPKPGCFGLAPTWPMARVNIDAWCEYNGSPEIGCSRDGRSWGMLLRSRPLRRARCAITDVAIAWSCVLSRSNHRAKPCLTALSGRSPSEQRRTARARHEKCSPPSHHDSALSLSNGHSNSPQSDHPLMKLVVVEIIPSGAES
jgi:hypothetical protein